MPTAESKDGPASTPEGEAASAALPNPRRPLLSNAALKAKIRKETGAHRTTAEAYRELARRAEHLVEDLLQEVGRAYASEVAARKAQGVDGHLPDLAERHVERGFDRLVEALKSGDTMAAPWPVHPAAKGVQA